MTRENAISAAIGLRRAVVALGDELTKIRLARPREGFPHRQLVSALPESSALIRAADGFIQEILEYGTDHSVTSLRASITGVVGLHTTAKRFTAAVHWSSDFASIDWWITERLRELGITDKQVLVAPGNIGHINIERSSQFAKELKELSSGQGVFSGEADNDVVQSIQESIEQLQKFHTITVSSYDGISPVWHPLVLGHELAHLRFNRPYIIKWLSGQGPGRFESQMVHEAIANARDIVDGHPQADWLSIRVSRWEEVLRNWLIEAACDTVAEYFYGRSAMDALGVHLDAFSDGNASDSHPSPEVRHEIQTMGDEDGMDRFIPERPHRDYRSSAMATFISLVIPLRDHIRQVLRDSCFHGSEVASEVASATAIRLSAKQLPSSTADWAGIDLGNRASTVASGLIQGLWRQRRDFFDDFPESSDRLEAATDRVSQALDALEFAIRFERGLEVVKEETDIEVDPEQEFPVPNVLWLSRYGVRSDDAEEVGRPSWDLRLGRYFIAFQKNEVAELDALSEGVEGAKLQRGVEIGWGDNFVLHPNDLVLAATFESLRLGTDCTAQVLSRSSLGRLGLLSATAVHVQPGFVGCLTLELVNLASVPLRLTPGQRIAQVVSLPAMGETLGYEGHFQGAGAKPLLPLRKRDWDSPVLARLRPEWELQHGSDGVRESDQ